MESQIPTFALTFLSHTAWLSRDRPRIDAGSAEPAANVHRETTKFISDHKPQLKQTVVCCCLLTWVFVLISVIDLDRMSQCVCPVWQHQSTRVSWALLSMWRWCVSIWAWPVMAFPVWDVPVQLNVFGAPAAAGAAGRTLPGHEEKVAAAISFSCADTPQRHWWYWL